MITDIVSKTIQSRKDNKEFLKLSGLLEIKLFPVHYVGSYIHTAALKNYRNGHNTFTVFVSLNIYALWKDNICTFYKECRLTFLKFLSGTFFIENYIKVKRCKLTFKSKSLIYD